MLVNQLPKDTLDLKTQRVNTTYEAPCMVVTLAFSISEAYSLAAAKTHKSKIPQKDSTQKDSAERFHKPTLPFGNEQHVSGVCMPYSVMPGC